MLCDTDLVIIQKFVNSYTEIVKKELEALHPPILGQRLIRSFSTKGAVILAP